MKTFLSLAAILLLLPWAGQAETLKLDFESYPVGTTGLKMGWIGIYGSSDQAIEAWQVLDPSQEIPEKYPNIPPEAPGKRVFATSGGGSPNYQMGMLFNGKNGFSDKDTVYYSLSVAPMLTGNNVQDLRIGAMTDGRQPDVIFFGVHATDSNDSPKEFHWEIKDAVSEDAYPIGNWYQLQLTIQQGDGGSATGSLAVRNLTAGETAFQPATGLQDIDLGLTEENKVSTWTGWAIRSYGRQAIDGFYLSTKPLGPGK